MCDQTPVEYKDGDIVWVKLGSCWWPGEVQDIKSIDEEIIAVPKKPIIAAVKFFDEDCYEFIKSIDRIYLYNCSKKNEFIRKGLDLHRAKHEYMKKFPTDVSKAEERTNGDPKIIDDPIFAPEKKSNVAALIFGTPKQKKSTKKSLGSGQKALSTKSTPSSAKSSKQTKVITHPRFLGYDDHEVRILVQSSEQVDVPQEEPEEKVMYKCAACGFSTERVDVSIMHHKSHIQGLFPAPVSSPKLKKRTQTKRPRKSKMTKSKTTSIMEDLQLIEQGLFFHSESSEDDSLDAESSPKRKRKKTKRKPSKNTSAEKRETVIDIRGDLLAEWDEDDSENETDTPPLNISQPVEPIEQNDEVKEAGVVKEKSCFDFNDEDEDEIVSASGGRKIPRVIPPPDRPRSIDLENPISSLENVGASSPQNGFSIVEESPVEHTSGNMELSVDSTLDRNEILKIIHQVDESSEEQLPGRLDKESEDLLEKDKMEDLDLAFKDILEATVVPDLPEIPHSLKFEQNPYEPKVTKLPEKSPVSEVKSTDAEMAARLINPKKRFVKSFEDFEQQIHNEQKKLQLEQAVAAIKEKNEEVKELGKLEATVEVAKLKTQLKNKLDNADYVEESKPKRPRLLRDRILSSHREELEDLHKEVPKEFDLIDTHTTTSDYSSVISLPRATSTVPDDLLESSYTITSDDKESPPTELSVTNEEDSLKEPIIEDEHTRPRRLSIKMSEINETPFELKETTQLLEVETEETLHLKPTQVFDISKESVNISEVEPLIETETVNSRSAEVESLEVDAVHRSEVTEKSHEVDEVEALGAETKESDHPEEMEEPKVSEAEIKISEVIEEGKTIEEIEVEEVSHNVEESITTDIVTSEEIEEQPLLQESVIVDDVPSLAGDVFDNGQHTVEDLSALTTLAAVSELSTNLTVSTALNEKSKIIEDNLTSIDKGNLNFVTMDDLAEGQVEISDVCVSKVKSSPMNLMNFSVDFGDSSSPVSSGKVASPASNVSEEEIHQPDSIEMSLGKVFEGESEVSKSDSQGGELKEKGEEQTCSSVVSSNSKPFLKKPRKSVSEKFKPPEYSSSSKLLEILTDSKPKSLHSDVGEQLPKTVAALCVESPSSTLLSKSKSEKFYSTKESVPFTKHLLKGKEIPKEINVSQVMAKPKDEKYSISKDNLSIAKNVKYDSKNSKFILKPTASIKSYSSNKSCKPVILSEKIIKRMPETQEGVSVRKVTSNNAQDFEDIDAYIIQKPLKKVIPKEEEEVTDPPATKKAVPTKGKAKILQQTIIKPATAELTQQSQDDAMFDINSMPIVLGDQILTTDGIEKMPVVISEEQQAPKTTEQHVLISNKAVTPQPLILKTYSSQKVGKSRIYQPTPTTTTKLIKSSPTIISRPGKQDKYIILPGTTTSATSKYAVAKRPGATKRMTPVILPTPSVASKLQATTEPSGNKIMIVTNQQGQQSRVLLTPAQQKIFGYPNTSSKLVKSTIKGNILQKTGARTSSPITKIQPHGGGEITTASQTIMSTEPVLVSVKSSPLRPIKSDLSKNRKFQVQHQKVPLQEGLSTFKNSTLPSQQKMIIIKNQQGQIVKRFQGTDDALLEQQVAEQVQAIKANSGSFSPMNLTTKVKPPVKRTYIKKPEAQKSTKVATKIVKSESVPPLAPISPKRTDTLLLPQTVVKGDAPSQKPEAVQQKPLNQLIIQDALGNQTTIMEGQILALPSGETVDGQPQSYMLVTLDESGNLAPLNNEALLSLDPNLTLGGDLSNMVLQLDDGAAKKSLTKLEPSPALSEASKPVETPELPKTEALIEAVATPKLETEPLPSVDPQPNVQTVTCSINNDPNQQLIITGDPISTQKFIESLTEGNADLANLLASAEGNILIQTDEQQILINTDSENQVLLPLGSERLDAPESDSNPIFATQPVKNQDILAAALADTDVFQQEQTVSPIHNKLGPSQLSPNSGLYPTGVANVLETTLSLSSPIMTPLEVPSTNNKKIPDEEMDILTTEVPKNVDLPITITDPNISQTVAQQQVVSLMTNELGANLELPLPLADQVVVPATEMHSPSYGFPLSSLEDSVTGVDVQKSFSGPISMPLLTEDDPQESSVSEVTIECSEISEEIDKEDMMEDDCLKKKIKRTSLLESTDSIIKDDAKSLTARSFLGTPMTSEEGLCTLGGAMCSSLSEPPPDMFDLSIVSSHFVTGTDIKTPERTELIEIPKSTTPEVNENSQEFESYEENKIDNDAPLRSPVDSPAVHIDENSCEIPVQPQIVTDLTSSTFDSMDTSNFESTKRTEDDESNDRKEFD
uniref:PWWP domain-containing protein n=1 Tax=Photinus pyralis TaxID=7054 RepID=A0A1Y1MWZ1_PHOPY